MKRVLSAILSIIILLSLSANVYAADTKKVIVTAEKTIIHKSASISSDKLSTAKQGYVFTPVGSTKTFWKMEFKKKNDDTLYTGYILKEDTEEVVEPNKSAQTTSSSQASSTTSKSNSQSQVTKSSSNSSTSTNKSLSTVYWTPNGDVYHSIPNCRSLARSKNIHSGTIAESRKHKACRNCVR